MRRNKIIPVNNPDRGGFYILCVLMSLSGGVHGDFLTGLESRLMCFLISFSSLSWFSFRFRFVFVSFFLLFKGDLDTFKKSLLIFDKNLKN